MKTRFVLPLVLLSVIAYSQTKKPIIILDGVALNPNTEFVNKLVINQIESLTTYDSVEAVSKYGEFLGGNGIVLIKTRFDPTRPFEFPENSVLSYGDKKPIVMLNGKIIDYEEINDLTPEFGISILSNRSIDHVREYGLQAINGVIIITTN